MTQDTTIIQGQQPYESKTKSNNNNFEMDGIGKIAYQLKSPVGNIVLVHI